MVSHEIPGRLWCVDRVPGHLLTWRQDLEGNTEVYQTFDYGETWTRFESLPATVVGYSRYGEQPGQCFAYSWFFVNNNIYFTNDGWNTLDSVQSSLDDDSISFWQFGSSNGLIYGTKYNSGHICVSSDTGHTWAIGYRNAILPGFAPNAAGAVDELWGKLSRVYVLHDTGRTAIDSILIPHLSSFPYGWVSSLIATDQFGEAFYLASREFWTDPPLLEVVLYHIQNYGAQVDSFYYEVPIVCSNVNRVFRPQSFQINAFPNPFNSSITISFTLAHASEVKMAVYDVLGRNVDGIKGAHIGALLQAGEHRIIFDGTGLSSGIYFIRLEAGGNVQTRKMILLK